MIDNQLPEALTFDDVLLIPAKSDVLPSEVNVTAQLTKNIRLNIPIISAAMDTVTESRMAIALAQHGGLGVIHRNLSIDNQTAEVDKVKRSESGMIVDPVTIGPEAKISEALELMSRYKISGVPITQNRRLVGILTNRDLRFETRMDMRVAELMTKENLITVPVGTTLEEAKKILHKYRIEKLPVVDDQYNLRGLITVKDIQKQINYPNACKDQFGRLRVGGSLGVTGDYLERADALVRVGVDLLVIDTAHAHTTRVLAAMRNLKNRYSDIEVMVGNISTAEAAEELIQAGASALKVGMGPGSICTTRVVSGAGMPQITAIAQCASVAQRHGVPLVADGGIKYSGDITKAIAAGADSVMIGSLFAGTDESPGEIILYQNRTYKVYRGMGSLEAMKAGSRDRYAQEGEDANKFVPEGIEGRVPHKGSVGGLIPQMVGGLKAGMGYCGCRTIKELKQDARFTRITSFGLRESHVHDVIITKEAPNYRLES